MNIRCCHNPRWRKKVLAESYVLRFTSVCSPWRKACDVTNGSKVPCVSKMNTRCCQSPRWRKKVLVESYVLYLMPNISNKVHKSAAQKIPLPEFQMVRQDIFSWWRRQWRRRRILLLSSSKDKAPATKTFTSWMYLHAQVNSSLRKGQ